MRHPRLLLGSAALGVAMSGLFAGVASANSVSPASYYYGTYPTLSQCQETGFHVTGPSGDFHCTVTQPSGDYNLYIDQ